MLETSLKIEKSDLALKFISLFFKIIKFQKFIKLLFLPTVLDFSASSIASLSPVINFQISCPH
jgi:hypothetical protein